MSETEVPDCPLCMEAFEIDDINFYPCTCGYQVCRFCWHRIRTDENGLCPACRKAYSEDPAMYQPLSQDELQKIKKERKQREVQQRQKASDNRQHLSNIRVIQKHLVFVLGLSNKMADPEVLRRQEYFGKYGKILKIVINPNTNYAGPQGPSASAYITYSKEEEALRTILSINNMQPPLKIRASLGTTKYCSHYLRNTICPKQDCMYLHDIGDMNASFTKEDMQAGKHQIFEKDLLDNYMLSMQKSKQSHPQNITSSNTTYIQEDSSENAWGDVESDSVLPSNASWAAIRDEKEKKGDSQKSRTSSVTSTDYPSIESSVKLFGTSGGSFNENKLIHEKKPDTTVPTDSTYTTEEINVPVESSTEEKKDDSPTQTKPVSIPYQQTPLAKPPATLTTPSTTPVTSLQLTNETTLPTCTTTITTSTSSTYPWPSITDLGLTDLRILPNDDDLGFDPFKESTTGLEDLIASERKQGLTTSAATTPKPTFSWDSFWPTNYGNSVPMPMMNSSYSLFSSVQSLPQQQQQQQQQIRPTSPYNPYGLQNNAPSSNTNVPSPQNPTTSFPFRFSNPPPLSSPSHPQMPSHFSQQQQQSGIPVPPQPSSYSRFPFQAQMNPLNQQPVITVTTSTATTMSTTITSSEASSDKNWQDGLRALLPNINISFASNWNQETDSWSSQKQPQVNKLQMDQQPQQQTTPVHPVNPQQPANLPTQQISTSSIASPPPGFSLLSSFDNKNKPVWPEKDEHQTQHVPAPPPGFHAPIVEPSFALATTATTVTTATGILSVVATVSSTIQSTSVTSATPIPQQQSKRNSQHLATHEDPSILWSKVLSDKANRDIETTNMVFPLPGETVDQALNSSSLPSTPPQLIPQHQHMMSWNSVVSGNQYGKSPTARDLSEPCTVNTSNQTSLKDGATKEQVRPQKPSPIFGSQHKHSVKKPTAHVKPLKCTPPTDGFTTVPSSYSRQQSSTNTGSRVSELDDFSTDIPGVPGNVNMTVTANIVRSFVEYPPVSQTAANPVVGKSKKKKRKGKDQTGLISEVVVGLSTSNTIERTVDEEKPKKGKNKKKNKSSPTTQRKNEDLTTKSDTTVQIIQNDDAATVSSSQLQAAAVNASGSSQDHEIVSRLTESTEKLLKNVLFETEAIKLNTEQISKDLKSALEKCKESSLSLSDLEKINLLLTPGKLSKNDLDDPDLVDTSDLERQVESARREAKLLEARLNDVIRKNMASELETLKRNTKSAQ